MEAVQGDRVLQLHCGPPVTSRNCLLTTSQQAWRQREHKRAIQKRLNFFRLRRPETPHPCHPTPSRLVGRVKTLVKRAHALAGWLSNLGRHATTTYLLFLLLGAATPRGCLLHTTDKHAGVPGCSPIPVVSPPGLAGPQCSVTQGQAESGGYCARERCLC